MRKATHLDTTDTSEAPAVKDFARLPSFDEAMRKLVKVPKAEIARRIKAEREARTAKK